jgi:hypothetical protein
MSRPPEDIFAALETVLSEELQCARRGDVEAACRLARRADALVRAARARGIPPDPASLDRLGRLYTDVGLALAQRASEVADRRARLRRGKTPLQAYLRNAGGR